jgi:hypothetical protein
MMVAGTGKHDSRNAPQNLYSLFVTLLRSQKGYFSAEGFIAGRDFGD